MQLLAVIVRYKTPLADSETLKGLGETFAAQPELLERIGVVVWDNSPEPLIDPRLPFPFEYRHTAENLGVSGAYNRSMEIAEARGCKWMLLLDQDTTIESGFLAGMLDYSDRLQERQEIAAVAPFLVDGARAISPGQLRFNKVQPLTPPFEGVHAGRMYAANSGTMMRIAALRQIGGFNEAFWLDLSDIVVFHLLHEQGKLLYVAGDLHLPHKVTLNDYDGSMSPQRYENFILAEGAYWDLYRTRLQNLVQTARLLARSLRQYRRYRNKAYARITLTHFLKRMFCSRRARLDLWKRSLQQRNMPQVAEGRVVG